MGQIIRSSIESEYSVSVDLTHVLAQYVIPYLNDDEVIVIPK